MKMNERDSHRCAFSCKEETITTIVICLVLLFAGITTFYNYYYYGSPFPTAEARCPNGYHKSASGDCEPEPVLHHDGLPRCPNGYHRSPDAECERVSGSSDTSSDKTTAKDTKNINKDNSLDTNGFATTSGKRISDSTTSTPTPSSTINAGAESTPGKCDESLWKHVYNPSRLQIVDNCITITGTIDSIRAEKDGDLHIRLAVDSQYSHLINQANKDNQFGDLVLEPICVRKVTQASAIAACQNFGQGIEIPIVGTHVKVTGSYVLDHEHNDWAEIHPITSIKEIPFLDNIY
jgi:hypothetical protein